ncbi:MAG: hypothetical protein Q8P31_03370, partial [Bacillota bacterium]|nr:hypothetical protein [Bacillota bacterium]
YFVFWRRPRAPAAHPGVSLDHVRETWYDKLLALALAAPMVAVGLRPAAAVGRLLAPALVASGYDSAALHHVEAVRFFAWPAVQGAALSLGLGAALLFVLYRLKFPTPAMDRRPSVEGTFLVPLVRLGELICVWFVRLDRGIDGAILSLARAGYVIVSRISRADLAMDGLFLYAAEGGARLVETVSNFDQGIDRSVQHTAAASARLVRGLERADQLVDESIDLMARGAARVTSAIGAVDRGVDRTVEQAAIGAGRAVGAVQRMDQAVDHGIDAMARGAAQVTKAIGAVDRGVDRTFDQAASEAGRAVSALRRAEDAAHGPGGVTGPQSAGAGRPEADTAEGAANSRQLWTLMNLNVATLLMALLIGLMLLVFTFWR